MSTFFTSDQHYGHKNICRFANRPFTSLEEMNEALIQNHNAVVNYDDSVWFLGDFAFLSTNQAKTILRRLNGNKSLVLGNHDKNIRNHRNEFIGQGLFNNIYDYREITIEKQHIVLFHYGMRVWNRRHHGT